jgi:hypothetical protein
MKKITFLLLIFLAHYSFSQTTLEWETGAIETGATVTSTELTGNTITFTAGAGEVNINAAGGYAGTTGNTIFAPGPNDDAISLTVTFDSPVNIVSVYHADPFGFAETLTFTPVGGSNSPVMDSHIGNGGSTAILNWSDVTSFVITGATSTGQYFIDEIVIAATLGLEDFNFGKSISISPNPSNSYIQISGLTKTQNYRIFNIIGTEISNGNISNNEKIDTQNLTSGLYLLKFDNGRASKFIKE